MPTMLTLMPAARTTGLCAAVQHWQLGNLLAVLVFKSEVSKLVSKLVSNQNRYFRKPAIPYSAIARSPSKPKVSVARLEAELVRKPRPLAVSLPMLCG